MSHPMTSNNASWHIPSAFSSTYSLALNIVTALEDMSTMLKDTLETVELQSMVDTLMADNLTQTVVWLESLERMTANLDCDGSGDRFCKLSPVISHTYASLLMLCIIQFYFSLQV
jgi:hypothetical protein